MKSGSGLRAVRGRRPTRGKLKTTLYRHAVEPTDILKVLDSIPIKIYYKDKDARWVYVNKSYYLDYEKTYGRIFGLKTPKDMIGKTVFDVCLREHAEKMFEDDMQVIKEGKSIVDKLEHFSTPDGAEIYTITTKIPRFDEKGNIMGLIGYSYDVTELKRAENKLRESEKRYHDLIENTPVGILGIDKKGAIIYENLAMRKILGVPEGEFDESLGTKLAELLNVIATGHADKIGELLKGKPISGIVTPFISVYGRRSILLGDGLPLKDSEGRITGGLLMIQDITERQRAEEALRERERFLADIFTSIQDGISILDKDMNIIRVNSILERWYPHAMPLVGKKCYAAYHGRSERCEVCPTWQTLKTGEAAYEVVPKRGPRGEIVGWLDLYSFPMIDTTTGQMRGVIEYVRDITERKQAEEALAREQYLMRAFMDNIPDRIYFKDTASRFIRINKAQADAFGLGDPIEAVGKTDFDFFTEEHARLAYEDEQRVVRTGKPLVGKEEKETWPGRPDTWVSTSKLPLRDEEGNIVGTFGISKDITDRKRAEEEAVSKRVAAEATAKVTEAIRITAEKYKAKIGELEEQIARLKNLKK